MSTASTSSPKLSLSGQNVSSLDDYEIVSKCGEGTYGCVFKAIHKKTKQLVALKKIVNVPKEDGLPVEIKYLTRLTKSKNVVLIRDYFWAQDLQLCIVFEFMDYDLWRLMTGPNVTFDLLQIKCLVRQILEGLYQCHSAGIMHRDVKPSNLLINSSGVLKLADFGLTTSFLGSSYLSNNVVSLYYRSPELLMGSHSYGPEVDMWSVGCILIEMVTNNYLFAGANEAEQLDLIFRIFGTPSEDIWPGVTQLSGWSMVQNKKRYPPQDLAVILDFLSVDALDLVTRLLSLDPKKRISSFEALQHPWFWTSPLPCQPDRLPKTWPLGSSRNSPRKYQSDFPRSLHLYEDTTRKKSTARGTSRRGSGRGGSRGVNGATNTGRAVRASRYSPYRQTYKNIGHSAQHPIVIAS
jgi:serine/threonine protein kinase